VLVYGLGLEAKEAIATSLFVVGVLAAVSVVGHARAGRVRWRVAGVFGSVAMVGAWLGGVAASYLQGTTLMLLFGLLMVTTAVAMAIKDGAEPDATLRPTGDGLDSPQAWAKMAAEGLLVGGITGLVGAGGGFLVVPALVLLAGLPMRQAIATSLVIIAMKSGAGLVGHLGHVTIDWSLAATIAGAGAVGAIAGTWLAGVVAPDRLRRVFAGLVGVAGIGMVLREVARLATASEPASVLVWSGVVGGLGIGLYVWLQFFVTGRALGCSTGFGTAIAPVSRLSFFADSKFRGPGRWRLWFLIGIPLGGAVAALTSGDGGLTATMSMGALYDAVMPTSLWLRMALLTGGGVLMGYGARMAGGCTSGHAISGIAMLNPPSMLAAVGFFAGGVVAVQLLFALGGLS